MTNFPRSPRLLKAGLVLIDQTSNRILRVVALQYNPETLQRSLQAQGVQEGGERGQALRLTGPPQETYTVEAVLDAAELPDQQVPSPDTRLSLDNQPSVTGPSLGILPQLSALEAILYPSSRRLESNNRLASIGTLEIVPVEAPLTIFVWSRNRTLPVRLTECSITEEAFDPNLNPIRARVNLTMRVLNVSDLGFDHRGGNLYLDYHRRIERLAGVTRSAIEALGISGI